MINIRNLYLSFTKEFYALNNINLDINKGEKVALIGNNESGKTMLLRVIARLEDYKNGEIYLNNINLKKVDFKQDISLGYVPQKFVFKTNKTVKQNLEYVLKIRNIEKASINFKMLVTTKNFGIENILDLPVKSLSKFQKTLVQLARVSLRKVDIFLIDDVFEDLEKNEQESILSILKSMLELNPESTFVFAFNDEKFANELGLKVIKIKNGSIVK